MDWNKITNNEEVKKLIEQRKDIEEKIKSIDKNALIMYELEVLSMPSTIQKPSFSYCDSFIWIVQDKENNILYASFEKQKSINKRKELIEECETSLDVNKLLLY